MTWLDALILGVIQGITEFLPISSSGHLVLMEDFLGLDFENLKSFDVMVHLATLLAILVYFWKDIWGMLKEVGKFFTGKAKWNDPYAKLIGYILIGTVPAVAFGLTMEDWIDSNFRKVEMVGGMMIGLAILFLLGEFTFERLNKKTSVKTKVKEKVDTARDYLQPGGFEPAELRRMKWWKALLIGVFQAFALVPGISRSGSTIVAGLFQGIKRETAARFSFLLGIPALAGAGLLTGINVAETGKLGVSFLNLGIGFISAFLVGLASVFFLMNYLKKHSLKVFSIYLIALGLSVFV